MSKAALIQKKITDSLSTTTYAIADDFVYKPQKTRAPRKPKRSDTVVNRGIDKEENSTGGTNIYNSAKPFLSNNITGWDSEPLTWRQKPISLAKIEQLAQRLEDFVMNDPKAYTIAKFLMIQRLDESSYERWCKEYPVLNMAHEFALMVIGARREEMGLEFNLSAPWGLPAHTHYSKVWRQEFDKNARVKAQAAAEAKVSAEQKGDLKVVMVKFEKSAAVPSRGDDDKGTMSHLTAEEQE